jgi:hypothetical protein
MLLFDGRFTKIYPEFHLRLELLTYGSNFSLFLHIRTHFSLFLHELLTIGSNFSLFMRNCTHFSPFTLNFSIISRRHSEFLTFCMPPCQMVIGQRASPSEHVNNMVVTMSLGGPASGGRPAWEWGRLKK